MLPWLLSSKVRGRCTYDILTHIVAGLNELQAPVLASNAAAAANAVAARAPPVGLGAIFLSRSDSVYLPQMISPAPLFSKAQEHTKGAGGPLGVAAKGQDVHGAASRGLGAPHASAQPRYIGTVQRLILFAVDLCARKTPPFLSK